jgi:hypothetical protein
MFNEIEDFLLAYFEALHTQDLALFDRVFHPSVVLYSRQDGKTVIRPFAEYRAMVAGRESPASKDQPRGEMIISIDALSDTMAVVKVRLRLYGNIMEDHLCLMKSELGWQIYSKFFHRAGIAA